LQDLALWSAYAIVEGAAGHLEVARKVFDTTIGSLPALSKVNFSLSLSLSLFPLTRLHVHEIRNS
jgi:hypothetical protein